MVNSVSWLFLYSTVAALKKSIKKYKTKKALISCLQTMEIWKSLHDQRESALVQWWQHTHKHTNIYSDTDTPTF